MQLAFEHIGFAYDAGGRDCNSLAVCDRSAGTRDCHSADPRDRRSAGTRDCRSADPRDRHDASMRDCNSMGAQFSLSDINLSLKTGERLLTVGKNGAGKSSLIKLLAGHMPLQTGIIRCGADVFSARSLVSRSFLSHRVGFIHQDPQLACVSPLVRASLAFALVQQGLAKDEIDERIHKALSAVGAEALTDRVCYELSGGEMARVALAQALAKQPSFLVLDEAFSGLDPWAHRELRDLVSRLMRESSHPLGVLEISHDPRDIEGATSVCVLAQGRAYAQVAPQEFLASEELMLQAGFVTHAPAPAPAQAALAPCAHVLTASALVLQPQFQGLFAARAERRPTAHVRTAPASSLAQASHHLTLQSGTLHLLIGASGVGKTTLALTLAGACVPLSGSVHFDGNAPSLGRIPFVFQRTEDALFCPSVLDEVAYGLVQKGMSAKQAHLRARKKLSILGVPETLFHANPYELSGGMRHLVGLAAAFALEAPAYILDEPSVGLDGEACRRLIAYIQELLARGVLILLITHDAALWEPLHPHVLSLTEGRAVKSLTEDEARALFCALHAPDTFTAPAALKNSAASAPLTTRADDILRAIYLKTPVSATQTPIAPLERNISLTHRLLEKVPFLGACRDFYTSMECALLFVVFALVMLFASARLEILIPLGIGIAVLDRVVSTYGRPCRARTFARGSKAMIVVPVLIFFLISFVCNALVIGHAGSVEDAYITLGMGLSIRVSGVVRSIVASLRIGSMIVLLHICMQRIDMTWAAHVLSRLCAPFVCLGMSLQEIELAFSIALLAIPSVYRELRTLKLAQSMRGCRFDDAHLLRRLRVWTAVFVPLIMKLFMEADARTHIMLELGYRGELPQRNTRSHAVLMFVHLCIFTAIVACVLCMH